jgi:hypothetical protein
MTARTAVGPHHTVDSRLAPQATQRLPASAGPRNAINLEKRGPQGATGHLARYLTQYLISNCVAYLMAYLMSDWLSTGARCCRQDMQQRRISDALTGGGANTYPNPSLDTATNLMLSIDHSYVDNDGHHHYNNRALYSGRRCV